MHDQIQTRSLRNYSAENLTSTLKDIKFPNYYIFSDVKVAYADLTKKISDAIDNVAPIKNAKNKKQLSRLTMIFTLRQNIMCKN